MQESNNFHTILADETSLSIHQLISCYSWHQKQKSAVLTELFLLSYIIFILY